MVLQEMLRLKTAEGTANFITVNLKKQCQDNFIGKISSLLNISNLKKFKEKIRPKTYIMVQYLLD